MVSLPAPPTSESLPAPPVITSLPEPPVRVLAAVAEPVMVRLTVELAADTETVPVAAAAFTVVRLSLAPTIASVILVFCAPVMVRVTRSSAFSVVMTKFRPAVVAAPAAIVRRSSLSTVRAVMVALASVPAAIVNESLAVSSRREKLTPALLLFVIRRSSATAAAALVTAAVLSAAPSASMRVNVVLDWNCTMSCAMPAVLASSRTSKPDTPTELAAVTAAEMRRVSVPVPPTTTSPADSVSPITTRSSPAPPLTLTSPVPPLTSMTSLPSPPRIVSLPPPPTIESLPVPPSSESAALPPVIVSWPPPPRMVVEAAA